MPTSMEHNPAAGNGVPEAEPPNPPVAPEAAQAAPAAQAQKEPPTVPWAVFLRTATNDAIKERLVAELTDIVKQNGLDSACCLAIFEPQDSIDSYELDWIFGALNETNPKRDRDVVLFVVSHGGEGEPAYQISKICKSFAKSSFKVIVPRFAKSAATLLAIGADEIHMGPLGHLGPIDPQIGGLPALGVSRALGTIASVAARYPQSADMFARYLQRALTVEQIGYCDRIADSAVQYAERLLSTKPRLAHRAAVIAKELVHEYKDHNFVIDLDEAQKHLGSDWIKTGTTELKAGEEIYNLLEMVNFFLGAAQSKKVLLAGGVGLPESIVIMPIKQ